MLADDAGHQKIPPPPPPPPFDLNRILKSCLDKNNGNLLGGIRRASKGNLVFLS